MTAPHPDPGPGLVADVGVALGPLELDAHLGAGPGEVVAVMGPNGAGKSTLLRALVGLTPLDHGSIALDGEVLDDPDSGRFVPPDRRRVGVVFQDLVLFPHLTAVDNVAFGLREAGRDRAGARRTAAAWLDRVLWMPAATSPFKQGDPSLAPAETRLRMVQAAIAGNDRFAASDLEVTRNGVSYTVDTVRQLRAHGHEDLALVVGGDSLAGFPRWREAEAIARMARLLVYRRPGDTVDLGGLPDWLAPRWICRVPRSAPGSGRGGRSATSCRTRSAP